ncbi:redoxin domain-containing protein [Verrucomicrobiota bacterium sgz303538]
MRSAIHRILHISKGALLLPVLLSNGLGAEPAHLFQPIGGSRDEKWSHVETLTTPPYQRAVLLSGIGSISFPITTKSPEAQRFFNQGVAQLHGFWHSEAERSFRQVLTLDPNCAMAYWGMAMANIRDARRATGFIKEAILKASSASSREQQWINAYAHLYVGTSKPDPGRRREVVDALEKLCLDFPDDIEARAFLLFQLWDNFDRGLPRPSSFMVDGLAQQVLAKQPLHHGVHQYLLQLRTPSGGERSATTLARAVGQAAPSIAHQWYSAGQALAGIGNYTEASLQYEAAARVEHAHLFTRRMLPDESHLYVENYRALTESLMHTGRVREAIDLAKSLIDLPRGGPDSDSASRVGQAQLLRILLDHEMWAELLALDGTRYLPALPDTRDETTRLRALGIAAFRSGQMERGRTFLRQLQIVRMKVRGRRMEAAEKAESDAKKRGLLEEEIIQDIAAAFRAHAAEIENVEGALSEISLAQALLQGDRDEATRRLKEIKDLPSLREAQVRFALDQRTAAIDVAKKAVEENPAQILPLAVLSDLQWRSGERDAALQTFQKLRPLSVDIDLTLPVFSRLEPVAKALSLPSDWRMAKISGEAAIKASGSRRDLEKLGPSSWSPWAAPAWNLTDGDGKSRTLTEFRNRPVLMLFYLGSGCVHCIEQLNSFAPLAEKFADAGIDLMAVSTESPEELHKTWEKAKSGEGFPFPLLADPGLAVFKTYQAFDEFNDKALHGAFLIDGTGLVRWRNIGAEPFTEPEWLLAEAKRLLGTPGKREGETASRLSSTSVPR